MDPDRRFPILHDPQCLSIPWARIAGHERQAQANHHGQGLESLAAAGGVTTCEAVAILEWRAWTYLPAWRARLRLAELIAFVR